MAGLGGLLYGIDFGTIAAAMSYLRELKAFTDTQLSLIVGAVMFGGIAAATRRLAWQVNFWWTLVPVSVLFVGSFFLPETKGKTLEELEHLFEKKTA